MWVTHNNLEDLLIRARQIVSAAKNKKIKKIDKPEKVNWGWLLVRYCTRRRQRNSVFTRALKSSSLSGPTIKSPFGIWRFSWTKWLPLLGALSFPSGFLLVWGQRDGLIMTMLRLILWPRFSTFLFSWFAEGSTASGSGFWFEWYLTNFRWGQRWGRPAILAVCPARK